MSKADDDDFGFEPIPGLPTNLPEDETILWSGSPEKWALGHSMFGTRWIAVLFVFLAVSSLFSSLNPNASAFQLAAGFVTLLLTGGLMIGFAMAFGWLVAINTVYTITNRRLVIRHGVTMPMAINVPLDKVAIASAKVTSDGTGDVSVAMLDGNRISLFAIWPHNRPWNWQGPAPAMRCIPDAANVARTLHEALVASVEQAGNVYVGERPKRQIRTTSGRQEQASGAERGFATAG